MAKKGFTLSELMLLAVCIGLAMAVIIPFIIHRKQTNNEGSVIGTLRLLGTCEEQFKNASQVDQDDEGCGEYGTLGELAGTANRRGSFLRKTLQRSVVNPAFFTPSLGPGSLANKSSKSGYHYQVFLPGPIANTPLTDNGTQGLTSLHCNNCFQAPKPKYCQNCQSVIDTQEIHFLAYAWPMFETTGIRCFALNQHGEIMVAPNQPPALTNSYEGDNGPRFDAAVSGVAKGKTGEIENDGDTFIGGFKAGKVAVDGQTWVFVNGE